LALAALLAALLLACVSPSAAYSDDLYRGYYKNGTTASKQAFAAAKAALQGLHLRCAIYTILQNNTYFPDSVRLRGASAAARCIDPPHARGFESALDGRGADASCVRPRARPGDLRRRIRVPNRLLKEPAGEGAAGRACAVEHSFTHAACLHACCAPPLLGHTLRRRSPSRA
jgi:hypothetical protein